MSFLEFNYGKILVEKIGGSQLPDLKALEDQVNHIKSLCEQGYKVFAVFSAMKGRTNELVKECITNHNFRNRDEAEREHPWCLIKGEHETIDKVASIAGDLSPVVCKQGENYPIIAHYWKNGQRHYEWTINPISYLVIYDLLKNNNPVLVAGYGTQRRCDNPRELSIKVNASDDVAALLSLAINTVTKEEIPITLVYQKGAGGVFDKHPDKGGVCIPEMNAYALYEKILQEEQRPFISLETANLIKKFNGQIHVCRLENWLKGTIITQ